jgi:O-antigen/teichoic acid export membrane protein
MLQKIIQSLITKGSVAVVNFLILIVTSKYLGVSTRGEISLIILNLAIVQLINEVYTGYSLVHFISKFNINKVYLNGIVFTLIACAITNTVLYLMNKQPEGYATILFMLSIIIILNTFNCVIILSKEFFKMYNFLSFFQPVTLLLGIFLFMNVYHIYTLDAFIWPLVISFSLSFLISSYFIFAYTLKHETKTEFELAPIIKNGFFCQLAVLMYILSGRLSYYLLETKPDVGLYSTASSLIESVLIITNSITPILLSRVAISGSNHKSIQFTLIFAKLCFVFSSLAVVILYFIPNSVFTFLLDDSYESSKEIMMWLSPGIIFLSFSGIISHYYSAIGKLKTVSLYNSFGFIITILLAPILINKFGIGGAALTTNLAYFITFIASLILFMKNTGLKLKDFFTVKEDMKALKEIFSGN